MLSPPEMPTSGDLKSGDCLFFHHPPQNFNDPRLEIDPAPNRNDLDHYNEVFHELHTIKICHHRFDARKNLCQ